MSTRPESSQQNDKTVATTQSMHNRETCDSIYGPQQKSVIAKNAASFDHEMSHLRAKLNLVVDDVKMDIVSQKNRYSK